MSTDIDTNHFKSLLDGELKKVETELEHIGRKNPQVTNTVTDWEAKPADLDIDTADDEDIAEKIEGFEENSAILKNLEIRYNSIKKAIAKIDKGTYGICEVGGEPIEKDRLLANPAATTCKLHMNM